VDLERVLAELRNERDAIDAAIFSLERLARPGKPGPGRPLDSATRRHTDGTNGFHRNLAPEESS
jgi:hypothetical protein